MKIKLLILLGITMPFISNAQSHIDTLYFDRENNLVEHPAFASKMRILLFNDSAEEYNRYRDINLITNKIVQDGKFSEVDMQTGKLVKEGPMYAYYDNGQIEMIAEFSNGEYHGNYTMYHNNGNFQMTGKYENGKTVGSQKVFNEQGVLEYEEIHSYLGVATYGKQYYSNGNLQMEYGLQNGKRHGIYREYYINGNRRVLGYYSNDLPDGLFTFYDEYGREIEQRRATKGKWQ